MWDAEVGGHSEQGTSTGEQSPKGGTLHGILHKREKGSVCAGGLMEEAVREMVCEDIAELDSQNLENWAQFSHYPVGQGRLPSREVI